MIASNRSTFVLVPSGVECDCRRLAALVAFVGRLPHVEEDQEPVFGERLPDSLRVLLPLLVRWAVSDDERRGEVIDDASDEALMGLWASVGPHLGRIDELEARHELRRRRSP